MRLEFRHSDGYLLTRLLDDIEQHAEAALGLPLPCGTELDPVGAVKTLRALEELAGDLRGVEQRLLELAQTVVDDLQRPEFETRCVLFESWSERDSILVGAFVRERLLPRLQRLEQRTADRTDQWQRACLSPRYFEAYLPLLERRFAEASARVHGFSASLLASDV